MKKAKVTIILPNFNSEDFIEKTIQSIINQSFTDWLLFLIDDNSNSKTKEILKKYKKNKKIKILFLDKNIGPGPCRNLGITKSNSDYLAFIDSDDLWGKNKLKDQIDFMSKNKFLFTYTAYSTFSANNNNSRYIKPPKKIDYKQFLKNTSIGTSTMMVKTKILENIKFTNSRVCEDFFFKCQLLKKVKFAYCLNKNLTKYQIRKNSLQSNKFRTLYWVWKINKYHNKLNFFNNLISVFFISLNSLKKYGFK